MSFQLEKEDPKIPIETPASPYIVERCQELGRHLVAAKDLHKGEIIIQELPLAVAPQKNSQLICPGCFKIPTVPTPCLTCKWPMCGQDCPGTDRHAIECGVLMKTLRKPNQFRDWTSLQDALMAVRCLYLKFSDNTKWKELTNMETNWNEWSSSPLHDNAKEVVQIIRTEFGVSEQLHDAQEILEVLAILDINAYEIKMPDVNVQGVYKLASLAEHNCKPNAVKSTKSGGSLLLTLRAAEDIPKAAHITMTYCDVLWPTYQRQEYLKWSKFFVCQCQRCADPKELGSYISSLLCPQCPSGTPLVPDLDSVLFDEAALWTDSSKDYKCLQCYSRFPAQECENTARAAESQLHELDNQCTPANVYTFEEWLEQWTITPAAKTPLNYEFDAATKPTFEFDVHQDIKLHPQHAFCLDACHTIFLLYSTESSSLIDLRRKEFLGNHLLQATDSLFPDISTFRATIQYELAITKAAIFAQLLDDDWKKVPAGLKTLAQEVLFLLTESLDILKFESDHQHADAKVQLFTLALNQLEEIKPFLENIIRI